MLLSKSAVCSKKLKLKVLKEQKVKGLLVNLPGAKIPIFGDIPLVTTLFWKYKMNAIVNKFLLAGDRFMAEMHLRWNYISCLWFSY